MTDASKKSTVTSPEGERLTIRKLTERECFRLMGFTDEEFDRLDDAVDGKGKKRFSRTAMYRFAGNSIVVDCLQHIFESIHDTDPVVGRPLRVGGLFTGIGAHHSALERMTTSRPGFGYEMRFQCEFDGKTSDAYDAIHGRTLNLGDVTTVHALTGDLGVDLLMVSPPCQDISNAGKKAGLGEGTRSGLIYEIPRIIGETPEVDRPRYIVWEDVPALVSKRFLPAFEGILETMSELGYTTHWEVINAADQGVAQSRKRLYAVSALGRTPPEMPPSIPLEKRLRDYLEPEPVADRYYLSEDRLKGLVWTATEGVGDRV